MGERTVLRNLSWAIIWDGQRHRYARDVDIVMEGDGIVHAGGSYAGQAQREIDGSGLMAMPGFVNIHGHLGTEPLGKGFYEELGSPKIHMSRIYEFLYTMRPDRESAPQATRYAIAELMKSGCTTVADMFIPYEGWIDVIASTGVRGFVAPMFRSGAWRTPNDHSVTYDWDHEMGERDMAAALEVCEAARAHASQRMGGIVMPAQAETCTPELIIAAHGEAKARGLPFQIHLGQSVHEFHEITRRYGTTPVGFLYDLGVLDSATTLAHAIFLDHHPSVFWHEKEDLQRIMRCGVNVVHCPVTFAYRGAAMHSLAAYVRSGINMAIGTDTFPHDMLNEMRLALMISKVVTQHVDALRLEDVFESATVGAARAIGRDDLGRLSVGAKADIVLVDTSHPAMVPCRDPLRSLVFSAGSRAVRDVFVAGEQVVANGEVLTFDLADVARQVQIGQEKALSEVPTRDWAGRSPEEIAPLSLASQ